MKLKDIDFIDRDFNKLKLDWDNENIGYINDDIETYFDTGVNSYVNLSNTSGITACSKYVDFVTSTFFPFDSSWISAKGEKGKEEAAKKVSDYMGAKMAEGGFYREMLKLIKEGTLYNKGMLQTTYEKGLSFSSIKNKMIYMNKTSNPLAMRAYGEMMTTVEDVILSYEGECVSEMQRQCEKSDNEEAYRMCSVITAVLPCNEMFYKKPNTKYKYKREYFVSYNGKLELLTKKGESECFYNSFPIMTYLPNYSSSLASQAVNSAMIVNNYETLILRFARKVLKPSMGMAHNTFIDNAFNLDEGGLVPLYPTDRIPQPIESAQRFPITYEEIRRHEQKINDIFKIALIDRINITNLSQFEAAANELAAIKAIIPAAYDLLTKIPNIVLKRSYSLLRKNDKEFDRLAAEAGEIEFSMSGVMEKIKKLTRAVGLGRVAQGIAPYVNIDQSCSQKIDGDRAAEILTDSWEVPEISVADEEVAEERKQMAQDQQRTQTQEEGTQAADAAVKQAQAQKLASESGQQ